MGYTISIGFSLLLLLSGCASQNDPQVQVERKKVISKKKTAAQEIAAFESTPKRKRRVVKRTPPKYQKIHALNHKRVTFSAEEANLRQVLYSIIGGTGLNLVLDKDIDSNIPITISVTNARAQDVLNTIMSMSGYHYTLHGNIYTYKVFYSKDVCNSLYSVSDINENRNWGRYAQLCPKWWRIWVVVMESREILA